MLEGPIRATVLADNGLSIGDLDVVEINEAFASVVQAWERELGPDMAKVNSGTTRSAILGATGTGLITKAVHELIRTDGELGHVADVLRWRPRHRNPLLRPGLTDRPQDPPVLLIWQAGMRNEWSSLA